MAHISVSKSTSLVMNIKSPRLSGSDRMSHFIIKTNYWDGAGAVGEVRRTRSEAGFAPSAEF